MKDKIGLVSVSPNPLSSLRQIASYANHTEEIKKKYEFFMFEKHQDTKYYISIFDDLEKVILEEKPKFVCFSSYMWNHKLLISLAKKIKRIDKSITLIWGGPEFTSNTPKDDLYLYDYIHYKYDGEEDFKNLLLNLSKGAGKDTDNYTHYDPESNSLIKNVSTNTPINPDFLYRSYVDFPLNFEGRDIPLVINYEVVRGCKNQCSYCCWRLHSKVTKDPHKSANEVKALLASLPPNQQNRVELAVMDAHGFEEIHYTFLKELDSFKNGSHVDLLLSSSFEVTDSFIKIANHHDIHVNLGVQSLSRDALTFVNRKPVDLAKTLRAMTKLEEAGILGGTVDIIAGLPKDTLLELIEVMSLFRNQRGWQLEIHVLAIFPNTLMEKKVYSLENFIYQKANPYEVESTGELPETIIKKFKEIVGARKYRMVSLDKDMTFKEKIEEHRNNPYDFRGYLQGK